MYTINILLAKWISTSYLLIILQVGFDAGDKTNFHQTSNSGTESIINITSFTNVGIPGKFIFRLGVAGSNNTANQEIVTPGKIIIYIQTDIFKLCAAKLVIHCTGF